MRVHKGFIVTGLLAAYVLVGGSVAGERVVVSLKDFRTTELKMAGINVPQRMTFNVKALGGGENTIRVGRESRMYAFAWVIDADTRQPVWQMDPGNTSRKRDDREFDGKLTLERGSYEVYFSAHAFAHSTLFTNFYINVDHRVQPLFGPPEGKKDFFSALKSIWTDDLGKEWENRAKNWGIEMAVEDQYASLIRTFDPPKAMPYVLHRAAGVKDHETLKQGFTITRPMSLRIYAIGESARGSEPVDYGWIADTRTRKRVWDMSWQRCEHAGGAEKNMMCAENIDFEPGDYVLYYITDDTHSPADWNAAPPFDPLNYGVTLMATNEADVRHFKPFRYDEDRNIIVSLRKVGDSEYLTQGFTLKADATVRVYAFGERSNTRRLMADHAFIMDARTRTKVWWMDVDRTYHGGGATKNRFVDELVDLPRGSYIVTYLTDDSHAYGKWNADRPFDPERYGITVLGHGERFDKGIVGTFEEERDRNVIAQIVRVGNNADRSEPFRLDRTTRVRVYSLGEGAKRGMYDYGWIEDALTGRVLWETTYAMTFHAGGDRKNRIVNTTIVLDRGEYRLRYRSDDSHSFNRWNAEPPEDQHFWGITLYREE